MPDITVFLDLIDEHWKSHSLNHFLGLIDEHLMKWYRSGFLTIQNMIGIFILLKIKKDNLIYQSLIN